MSIRSRALRASPVIGLQADPDTATIDRLLSLQATIGAGLNGRNTDVVGYDRGDPAHSLTGWVAGAPDPAAGYAAVYAGKGNAYTTQQTIQDTALTNPDLDPYNALLLARMSR